LSSKLSYDDTLKLAKEILGKGISPYDICIAWELSLEIIRVQNTVLERSLKARQKMKEDRNKLYQLALDTYRLSYGAATPGDVASGVVTAYLSCGMDVGKAKMIAKTEAFVLGKKEEEA
jgi:hypothetical protein